MDRPAIKRQARELIGNNRPRILAVSFLFLAISGVLSYLGLRLVGPSPAQLQQLLETSDVSSYQQMVAQISTMRTGSGSRLLYYALNYLGSILSMGFLMLLLRMVRGQEYNEKNLMDGFPIWWKVILLDMLTGIFIFLWTLLLIVPGIIAAYKYRMARYLMITHPEYSLMDCIRESKNRMDGHKGEMFVLDLSFLGWKILVAIPIVGWILSIWVTPYVETTSLLYYEAISAPLDTTAEDEPYGFES